MGMSFNTKYPRFSHLQIQKVFNDLQDMEEENRNLQWANDDLTEEIERLRTELEESEKRLEENEKRAAEAYAEAEDMSIKLHSAQEWAHHLGIENERLRGELD